MEMDLLLIFTAISILKFCNGLIGPNVCSEQQNYTLTTRIKYQQPVTVKTYQWCLNIPPRCSSSHTEMREKWKVQTEQRSNTLYFCCVGFQETEEKCIPKCPEGYTGDICDEVCPANKWGPSCYRDCRCPKNSICDSKNGKCVCSDGWYGSSCDVFTIAPFTTQSRDTKPLFDWSTPDTTTLRINNASIALRTPTMSPVTTSKIDSKLISIDDDLNANSILVQISNNISTTSDSIVPALKTESSADIAKNSSNESSLLNQPKIIVNTTLVSALPVEITTFIATKLRDDQISISNIPTSQIESPITSPKPIIDPATDSPITVILHNIPKLPPKDKTASRATESSIISLTVLKSTATTTKKKIQKYNRTKPDSELVKITLNSGINGRTKTVVTPTPSSMLRNVTLPPVKSSTFDALYPLPPSKDEPRMKTARTSYPLSVAPLPTPRSQTTEPTQKSTSYTMMTTDIQTEEIKHVLTEPEQITSVAGDEDMDERRDDLYSTLSIAMGIAAALILVATIIVLVARYRRDTNSNKMNIKNVETMMNASEDEIPSSYIRSVFHNPTPDLPMTMLPIGYDNRLRYGNSFMQPVIIHAVSPILVENFRDILESHYDHPKPPRPASIAHSDTNHEETNTFTTMSSTFHPYEHLPYLNKNHRDVDLCLPVTEEAIKTLKLEHHSSHILEMDNAEPVYDEIPWRPLIAHANEIINSGDEAVTEL